MSGVGCHRPENAKVVRAGAKRLHGWRFPPEGLGLDDKGLQAPDVKKKSAIGCPKVLREGSLPEGPRQTFRLFAAIGWLGERKRVEPGRQSRRVQ
jgi:hypothetical protein